jgi:hypothetical protein
MILFCSGHRDSIKRIQYMDSFGRYISLSKVGEREKNFVLLTKNNYIGRNSLHL